MNFTQKNKRSFALVCALILVLFTFNFNSIAQTSSDIDHIVDPSEVQKFEESYETWIQNLTQTVAPSMPVTVLVRFEYSDSPDKLDIYDEMKANAHLPGLPDLADPHLLRPTDSPVYSLLARQNIKLIFDGSLTDTQKNLLNEVLTTKLKIKKANGDQVVIEQLGGLASQSSAGHPVRDAILIMLGVLIIALIGATKKKSNAIKKIAQNNLLADPLQLILTTDPRTLQIVVQGEKPATIAVLIQNSSETIASTLLKLCTREQCNQIKALILRNSTPLKEGQLQYLKLLFAAKIHRQAKWTAKGDEVDAFTLANNQLKNEKAKMKEIMNALIAAAKTNRESTAPEATEVTAIEATAETTAESTPVEVNHENQAI